MSSNTSNVEQTDFDKIFETLRKLLGKFSKKFVQGNVKTEK